MKKVLENRSFLMPIGYFLGVALIFFIFWGLEYYRDREWMRGRTAFTAEQAAIRLDEFISVRINLVERMKEDWRRGVVNTPEIFADEVAGLIKEFPGLQAVNYIDQEGFIRWVVPEETNLAAKNRNLREHAGAAATFLKAEATGVTQVTPPINLLQGGRGIASYIPIDVGGRRLGYLNAVFRIAPLVEDCLARGVLDDFNIAIFDDATLVYANAEPSHVLLACGLPPLVAHSSIRMSMGKWTEEADIDTVFEVLPPIVEKLRSMSPLMKVKK